ncbi:MULTISPECIES: acetyl-CoA carboxylase biotin carboxyl carrier protein [Aneurinibacillus]|jgi:acetyl-CoA carboxylase biotin carboxyl carrier protein|uniref:Biotin carboxyl carrier protein of acetyl-CoA carboxylase n=1 Tax=Aneurinibacillus thermoaerophilus TaxID=143495 RepID=A0A1G8E8M1_ANETH|nr:MULTISPECIES: acetyl-CoA carboxylase biotin carboxyl carrier protein [Aneurinibacillus]AMA72513.1 acetyl-CoA carboxylase biotin carboxyl carrier protein subunit [Aneurinibacillus sp. XH2]MED0675599.1 acetyl-CoA carboxylase biotin carboxyl carrier protein [Aneurinibacillus thermoaerophilus]MED0681290.1 acetyl-CoA carboxylase biotin carboxyl carrier protein [Aneurinibacillus thermoaerophilus]MED0735500.1 acetyl-CoA carboxylase biotin carboxyl carrier protein [Aneurinibacillus thermoaerophilus]
MFKIHEIREIIKLVDQSSITEFKVEEDGMKVVIKKGGSASVSYVAVESAPQAVPAPQEVPAPAPQAVPPVPAPKTEEAPAPASQTAPVAAEPVDDTGLHKITSPMVGTFYKAPEPGASPYVQVGDKVKNDTIVCIVEAMKLFNEIEAEVTGEIVKVLVEDGQLVEYGQPLFLVKPE